MKPSDLMWIAFTAARDALPDQPKACVEAYYMARGEVADIISTKAAVGANVLAKTVVKLANEYVRVVKRETRADEKKGAA